MQKPAPLKVELYLGVKEALGTNNPDSLDDMYKVGGGARACRGLPRLVERERDRPTSGAGGGRGRYLVPV